MVLRRYLPGTWQTSVVAPPPTANILEASKAQFQPPTKSKAALATTTTGSLSSLAFYLQACTLSLSSLTSRSAAFRPLFSPHHAFALLRTPGTCFQLGTCRPPWVPHPPSLPSLSPSSVSIIPAPSQRNTDYDPFLVANLL